MATEPLTGARYPASSDSPAGYQQIQNAVFDLAGRTVPIFANASTRTSAVNAWVASGKTLVEGQQAYMQDDHRVWRYNGSAWEWPKAAQGELGYVQRTSQAGPIASGGGNVDVAGTSVAITIPSTRKVRAIACGQIVSDVAGTIVALFLVNSTSGASKAGTHAITTANAAEEITLVLRESLAAGTYSYKLQLAQQGGTGGAYTTAEILSVNVEDLGG